MADVVLGLVSPKQQQVEEYFKYNVDKFRMSFVALHLMKNRYGAANKMLPLFFNPIAGHFWDLPLTPRDEQSMSHYYKEALKLEEICRLYSPKSL